MPCARNAQLFTGPAFRKISPPLNEPGQDLSADSLLREREKIRRALARVNIAAAVILTALLLLLILAVVAGARAENSAERARQATLHAQEELWNSYLAQGRASLLTGLPGRRTQSLAAMTAAAKIRPSLELRNTAIAALALTDLDAEGGFLSLPRGTTAHSFDPHLGVAAFHDSSGRTLVQSFSDPSQTNVLTGPQEPARASVFSPSGNLLAVAYARGQIIVWDLPSSARRFTTTFDDRHGRGPGLAFTPQGDELVVGDLSIQKIRFLDTATGREIRQVAERFPERILLHDKLPHVASVTVGGRDIIVQNWENSSRVEAYTNATPIMNFAWAPARGLLAAADGDGAITVWDSSTQQRRTIAAHEGLISRLAFNADGSLLASGSWDGSGRLWDPSTGRLVLNLERGFPEQFSTDGSRLAFEHEGAGIGFWNLASSTVFRTVHCDAGPRKTVFSVSFSDDGHYLAATGNDGVRILSTSDGREVAMLPIPGGNQWGIAAHFSPGNFNLIASAARGFYIWPLQTNDSFRAGLPSFIPMSSGEPGSFSRSADGRALVAQLSSSKALLLDLHAIDNPLLIPIPGVNSTAISPDGNWIATGTAHGSGHHVWDRQGRLVVQLDQENGMVDFSPDGRWLVTSATTEFTLWETGSWKRSKVIPRAAANERSAHSAFSPDSSILALSHSPGVLQLVDPTEGTTLAMLKSPDPGIINHLAFSPDGSQLAVASTPNLVQIWNLNTLRQQLSALALDWSPHSPGPEFNPPLATVLNEPGNGRQLGLLTITLGLLVFGLACLVFRHHRQLVRCYAEIEGVVEQRGRELDLARAEIMHSQKMKALGTLAAGIAHDFNNLLSVIRISNDLNEEARSPAEIKTNAAEIESAVQQGKGVVRSMLGYCKPADDSGPFCLAQAVQASLGLLSRQFLSGIQLQLDFEPSAPEIAANRGALEQIILNLLINASEAMKGEGCLHVSIKTLPGSSDLHCNVLQPASAPVYLQLAIRDTGPGIDPALVTRLFEPFYTTKITGAARGTGLGLSIVYTIASREGFGIAVHSTPGDGADFRILIPAMGLERTVAKDSTSAFNQ